jgi:hypothetical protein
MAGLLPQTPTPPPTAGGPAPAGPGSPPTPGGPQQPAQGAQPKGPPLTEGPVDPEMMKKYVANCMSVVTGGLPTIIKTVTQSPDKVAALAQSAVFVVLRVEDSLEQSGGQLNLAMTFEGGAETVTDIVDAMQKAGVYTYSQKEIDAAFLRAVDQYRMIRDQQGRLDPAMFRAKIEQLKQAQTDGTLDKQYPGLTEFANQAKHDAKPSYKPQGAQDGDGPDTEDAQDQQQDSQPTDGDGTDPETGADQQQDSAVPPDSEAFNAAVRKRAKKTGPVKPAPKSKTTKFKKGGI